MMACKHFIIANSTFSWWGAWLSNNLHKYVIAPTPWFNTFTKQGVLCPDWIHLKCDRNDLFNKSNFKVFELVSDEDLKKIDFEGFFKSIGEFGISLISNDENSKIRFLFDEKLGNNLIEYIIEFKLFSNKKSLIKINYGQPSNIVLGYNKGYSKKYLHLSRINLNDLILNINDDSLIIENITIKSVDSRFKLTLK